MSITYTISGRGAKGGTAKAVLIFTVSIKVDDAIPNSSKTDLEVFVEGPEEGQPKINIMGGERGTFHVGFTPALPGQYWIDFIFKGVLANETFLLPIKDMFNKIPTIPYTGKNVPKSGGSSVGTNNSSSVASAKEDQRRRDEEEARKAEEAKEEAERKEREEAGRRAQREEAERKAQEEAERKAREEAERKAREEVERKAREEAERKAREEAERKTREEAERKAREDAEIKAREEEERIAREEFEREEEERKKMEEKKKQDELERKAAIERKRVEVAEKRRKDEERKKIEDSSARATEEQARAAEARAVEEQARAAEARAAEERVRATQTAKKPPTTTPAKTVTFTPPSSSKGDYVGHVVSMNFVLRALNSKGEQKTCGGDKEIINVEANDQKITLIEDAGDGTYSFDYKCVHGENKVSVSVRGKTTQGFPLSLRRKTMSEIEDEILQRELENEMRLQEERLLEEDRRKEEERILEEMRREEELKMEKQMEEEMRRQEEEDRRRKEEEEKSKRSVSKSTSTNTPAPSSDEAEIKLREIEERKRKIAEKRAEIARKREKADALASAAVGDIPDSPATTPQRPVENVRAKVWEQRLQNPDGAVEEKTSKTVKKPIEIPTDKPASKLSSLWEQRAQEDEKKDKPLPSKSNLGTTPNKGTVAARWLQSAQEDEKKEDVKTKVDIPAGTGATRTASLWKDRLTGNAADEKKVEKTQIDLGGKGASKVASVWQNRVEGKEPEPVEIKKTTIDIPQGAGASKVASLWQSKLEEKPAEPKIEKGAGPRKTGPSALATQWEQNATTNSNEATSTAKKDIEELKALMAKERDQVIGGGSSTGGDAFSTDVDEISILLNFLSTHLKGETIPQKLPFSTSNPKVFTDLSDGIALCKFFNKMIPDMLDVRVITMRVSERRDKIDNWNLCVQSGRAAGCRLSDVKVDALADGDAEQIQKVIFQIAKVGLETDIKMCDDYLTEWIPGADVETIAVMNIDDLLLKWVNGFVSKAGQSRVAKNLTKDFQDSFFYTIIFNEILGLNLDLDVNELERAEFVVMSSEELNRGPVITLQGIVDGVYWQNYVLLCSLLLTAAEVNK